MSGEQSSPLPTFEHADPPVRVVVDQEAHCERCERTRGSSSRRTGVVAVALGLAVFAVGGWALRAAVDRLSPHGGARPSPAAASPRAAGDPEAAAEHLRRGSSLVEQRDFAAAESEFRRATESDPGDPLAWAQLGAVLALLRRDQEAFTCYQRALDLDPASWLAHYNLAVWHARRGELEKSLARADAALASVPPWAVADRRAVVHALLEEPALASLRADPRFPGLLAADDGAAGGERR